MSGGRGARGIRTLETSYPVYRISSAAPSTRLGDRSASHCTGGSEALPGRPTRRADAAILAGGVRALLAVGSRPGARSPHRDDVAAGIRDFTQGKGVQVWFETQREPDLVRIVDLMGPRGRIVLIAGRQARPIFPVGPFYVKGLSLTSSPLSPVPRNAWKAAG